MVVLGFGTAFGDAGLSAGDADRSELRDGMRSGAVIGFVRGNGLDGLAPKDVTVEVGTASTSERDLRDMEGGAGSGSAHTVELDDP